MADWSAPRRPAAYAEEALMAAILDGTYPPGSTLPGERDLAAQLGVTRPTLRETLQRLACDGWLTIQQGKSTQVNDVWRDGGLGVLGALVRYGDQLPPDFVPNLLDVRLALAPAYARAAVEHAPDEIVAYLEGAETLDDDARALAAFDWGLHRALTLASRNPVYTLILNGFSGFYEEMAARYFARPEARASSRAFYAALLDAAREGDVQAAERVTERTMLESLELWRQSRE
ncbi:MAG: fatty acid metabolism transcriptional regulator FadR [Anaerolineae bacterium]|nr:fatty acid metabolism transcriptional regulator FadR [Anaerolineae bacterium]